MTTLTELADRVEKADGPDRELDSLICAVQYPGDRDMARMAEKGSWTPTASIDAAMTLVPEGAFWSITMNGDENGFEAFCATRGMDAQPDWRSATTPALALCAAALRARAHQEEGK